jgi:penicillin-binding protein 1A
MNRPKPSLNDYYTEASYREDSVKWAEDPLYGWCNKNFKPDGSKYNLYKDGLRIYTTIDSRMQEYAEQSLREHLSKTVQPLFFKVKKGKKKAPFGNDLTDGEINDRLTFAMKHSNRYKSFRNLGFTDIQIRDTFKKPIDIRVFTWKGIKDTIMSPWDSIRYAKYYLHASFMATDPHTGYVRAYVGGPDFMYFKYDGVMTQKRQVGSTIKPFLYTLAMKEGYKPCDMVPMVPVSFKLPEYPDSSYTPKNDAPTEYDGKMVTLRWGLAMSVNWVAAFLLKQYGPQSLIDLLRKVGIKGDLPAVPSICLGVPEISLYDLVGAYTAFPNKGIYTQPIFVTRILDKNGNVLTTINPKQVEAINEHTAYLMLQMLMGVVHNGTASRIRSYYNLMNEIGGKTGTTQNQSDGWFVGVTPDLVAGAWVGGDEPAIHFNNMSEGQGSSMALPIFALFMQKVYADKRINLSQEPFERPEGYKSNFDCPMISKDEDSKTNFTEDDFK